jgi:putative endonuclease
MGTERVERGRWGEDVAAEHLVGIGMEIIDRNWRCRHGEIDIVARDGQDIVICEVKTRGSRRFGTPLSAVTTAKVRRLRLLASRWLAAHDARAPKIRLDVVGIVVDGEGVPLIEHVRGVG